MTFWVASFPHSMGGFSQERPIKCINTTKQSTSPGNRQSSWNFRGISVLRVCQVNELGSRENSPEGPVWEAHRRTHVFPMTRRVLTHPSTITSGKSSWAAPAGCLRAERRLSGMTWTCKTAWNTRGQPQSESEKAPSGPEGKSGHRGRGITGSRGHPP